MYIHFEEFAVSSLTGTAVSPPKSNGKLNFDADWTQTAFAIAIELAKQGYFEWEEFRQGMIEAIAAWESSHDREDPSWSYYNCWTEVLERLVLASGVLSPSELQAQYRSTIQCKNQADCTPHYTSHSSDADTP